MSGVRAAAAVQPSPEPGVESLMDALYEIVADGVQPHSSQVSTQQIETLLHEHARSPKSREEMLAFFQAHGLSLPSKEQAGGFALPPLVAVPTPVPMALEPTGTGQLAPVVVAAPGSSRSMIWVAAACGAMLVAVALVLGLGYRRVQQLEADLSSAQQRSDARDRELQNEVLGVRTGVESNGQVIRRMDLKSDLLIESLIPSTPAEPLESAEDTPEP